MAFSQHQTQGGLLVNYKDALKMLHIDSEHKSEDIMDLQWIIRKPNLGGRASPSPVGKNTTYMGFGDYTSG